MVQKERFGLNLAFCSVFVQCIQAYVTCSNLILQNPVTSQFLVKIWSAISKTLYFERPRGVEIPRTQFIFFLFLLLCPHVQDPVVRVVDDQGVLPVPLVPPQACHQLTRGHCSSSRDLRCWSWCLTWPGYSHCHSCSCHTQSCSGRGSDCRNWCRSLTPHKACSGTGWCW